MKISFLNIVLNLSVANTVCSYVTHNFNVISTQTLQIGNGEQNIAVSVIFLVLFF